MLVMVFGTRPGLEVEKLDKGHGCRYIGEGSDTATIYPLHERNPGIA